jgi:hypothetical protein
MTKHARDSKETAIQQELNRLGGRVLPASAGENRPGRRHKKAITTWQDQAVVKLLKEIAYEEGVTQQKLIAEGLNAVLIKYCKPAIAEDR